MGEKKGRPPGGGPPRAFYTLVERYCVAIVALNRERIGPIGLAKLPPDPPAKQRPTGLLPDWVTINEPESPERMNVAGVMIWPVKVATPEEYPTWIVTL